MTVGRRIVLFGPPLCGKRTLMRAYAASEAAEIERATLACGSESMPHELSRARLPKSHAELITIGGAVWNVDAWWPLLTGSSAIVLLLDSQAGRESADREHVVALAMAPGFPRLGCVVWTKEDLVTTHGLERVTLSLEDEAAADDSPWRSRPHQTNRAFIASWPTFSTRMDDEASMRAPVTYLLSELDELA